MCTQLLQQYNNINNLNIFNFNLAKAAIVGIIIQYTPIVLHRLYRDFACNNISFLNALLYYGFRCIILFYSI